LLDNIPEQEDQQVVILLKALAAEVNQGYQNVNTWVVDKVNGEKIWNMNDLVKNIENSQEPYIIFEDQWNKKIIVDREKAKETHQEILEIYRIPLDRSEDLLN
jgi:non-homologous end joining protein Ku